MKEQGHGTPGVCPGTSAHGVTVALYVHCNHPLLQLKRALPWDALFEVMRRHWQRAGKNTDGRPGLPWDVALYVPLVVLRLVKPPQRARDGSVGVGECGGTGVHWPPSRPQSPDSGSFQYRPGLCGLGHGRVRGGQGVAAPGGPRRWLCRCQHPVVRYHGAGVTYWVSPRTRELTGGAQRCGRALAKLKTRAVVGVDTALAQVQTLLRTVKEHPLFAKGTQAKRQVLTRLLTEVGQWIVQTRLRVQGLGSRRARVTQHALTTLQTMHEVAKRLIPQIVPWITTGVVAKGKILQAGVTQARALVRHKAGKEVEFGLP